MNKINYPTPLKQNKLNLDKISRICTHSNNVTSNSVFVAIKGRKHNGHNHLKQAIKKGASILIIEDDSFLKNLSYTGTVYVVPNTRQILSYLLNEFYHFPSEKMFCVGVTGTNGKSTVSQMLAHIFSHCGWQTGLIGTVNTGLISPVIENRNNHSEKAFKNLKNSGLTTPDPMDLYHLLNQFYKAGAQATVMETSSIGLDQKRVNGVDFNLGIFTNLTEDHLDYHSNIESYFQAKKNLFEIPLLSKHRPNKDITNKKHFLAILNFDDPYGVKMAHEISVPYISYGSSDTAIFQWKVITCDLNRTVFKIRFHKKTMEICLPMPGLYNVSNAAAALCSAHCAGFSINQASQALQSFSGIKGRLERVSAQPQVFVDYAHTPNALESVLNFLKTHKKNNCRLIIVFGCGGERDQMKRPQMTKIAQRICDSVILTSDNPRGEDPLNIINDCMKNISNKQRISIEVDRKQAIEKAIRNADSEDIILIAGKGHETEQIIKDKRLPFDDVKIALQILSGST